MSSDVSTGQKDTREEEVACAGSFFRRAFRSTDTWPHSTGRTLGARGARTRRSSVGSSTILDSVWAAGAHLMGRVTYEEMAAFWPTSTSEYARPMNEIPKVVFSKTLERADWPETRIARGGLSEEIGSLQREAGNDLIAYGGATLDQGRHGLVWSTSTCSWSSRPHSAPGSPCSRICPRRCTSSSSKRPPTPRASPFTSTGRAQVSSSSWSIRTNPSRRPGRVQAAFRQPKGPSRIDARSSHSLRLRCGAACRWLRFEQEEQAERDRAHHDHVRNGVCPDDTELGAGGSAGRGELRRHRRHSRQPGVHQLPWRGVLDEVPRGLGAAGGRGACDVPRQEQHRSRGRYVRPAANGGERPRGPPPPNGSACSERSTAVDDERRAGVQGCVH